MSNEEIIRRRGDMGIKKYFSFMKNTWFIGIGCFVLGAAIVLGIRFFSYKPDDVHYHANFAVYLNGQRELFKSPIYYTEEAACTLSGTVTPSGRVHMHDNVNDVIHVEDHAVTWGQFFQNLGWNMGATYLVDRTGVMYQEDGNSKLHLILNGQDYTDFGGLENTVIKDQDKLLVSFGNESGDTIQKEYKAIPSTAKHYDTTPDPASCSGNHDAVTVHDRLMHVL